MINRFYLFDMSNGLFNKINVKELKLLVSEKVELQFQVRPEVSGFTLYIFTSTGQHSLISQRGSKRVFKTLDALFSFMRVLEINRFEVQVYNDKR
ncbi:hypothetical protein RJ46_18250 [Vibrio sinaloensis]|nr:hypothetical protein RJ46_18250 [Vibrio sinaloensis]